MPRPYTTYFGYDDLELMRASRTSSAPVMWTLGIDFNEIDPGLRGKQLLRGDTLNVDACLRIFSRPALSPFERTIGFLPRLGPFVECGLAGRSATDPDELALRIPMTCRIIATTGSASRVRDGLALYGDARLECKLTVSLDTIFTAYKFVTRQTTAYSAGPRGLAFVGGQSTFSLGLLATLPQPVNLKDNGELSLVTCIAAATDVQERLALIGTSLAFRSEIRATCQPNPGNASAALALQDSTLQPPHTYKWWAAFRGSNVRQEVAVWTGWYPPSPGVIAATHQDQRLVEADGVTPCNCAIDLHQGDLVLEFGGLSDGAAPDPDTPYLILHEVIVDPVAEDGGGHGG